MKLILAFLLFVWLVLASLASADSGTPEACATVRFLYENGYGGWCRKCGPTPGANYQQELRKDCRQTVSRLKNHKGSTWEQEMGWATEEQCKEYL